MKKKLLSLVFVGLSSLSFSQEIVNGIEIRTENLERIVYKSQAEKDQYCAPRIEDIKSRMANPELTDEQKVAFAELLWRFENSIVKIEE